MRLESVRELKSQLPKDLERAFAVRAAVRAPLMKRLDRSPAVALAASRKSIMPSYFLGVSAKGKRGYRLAVRLQDRSLERSSLVEEISRRAKGEVDVRYVGQIRARLATVKAAKWYRTKNRPLMIGSSVGFLLGNGYVMAGTLGCFVRKASSTAPYILSNNHVLADENRYKKGGAITQPGELDGGGATADRVAKLSAFVTLQPGNGNSVDCAIAKVDGSIQPDPATLKGIGTLAGLKHQDVEIGDTVHKVGRTTGVREGRVTAIEVDGVSVQYEMGYVSFDDQIEIEGSGARSFSDAGDSGSLIVDDDMGAAALLFAGGDHGGSNGKGLTYANPIEAVLSSLKVQLLY